MDAVRACISGVLEGDSDETILCDGVPMREMLAVNPGGSMGAGDEGLEELVCSWKAADDA